MENTRDLAKFGHRERAIAGELLSVLHTGNDKTERLSNDGIAVEFNLSTGFVFLVDDDYNVALMEDGKLVDWLSCPECGTEGTQGSYRYRESLVLSGLENRVRGFSVPDINSLGTRTMIRNICLKTMCYKDHTSKKMKLGGNGE